MELEPVTVTVRQSGDPAMCILSAIVELLARPPVGLQLNPAERYWMMKYLADRYGTVAP